MGRLLYQRADKKHVEAIQIHASTTADELAEFLGAPVVFINETGTAFIFWGDKKVRCDWGSWLIRETTIVLYTRESDVFTQFFEPVVEIPDEK